MCCGYIVTKLCYSVPYVKYNPALLAVIYNPNDRREYNQSSARRNAVHLHHNYRQRPTVRADRCQFVAPKKRAMRKKQPTTSAVIHQPFTINIHPIAKEPAQTSRQPVLYVCTRVRQEVLGDSVVLISIGTRNALLGWRMLARYAIPIRVIQWLLPELRP
jgi:hypothetical protein